MERNLSIKDFANLREMDGVAGGQGTLHLAEFRGETVVLKVMSVRQDGEERAFERLLKRTEAISACANPHVVRYIGCFRQKTAFSPQHIVVVEHLKGETLKQRLVRDIAGIGSDDVLRLARDCASALADLADRGILHRDITPSNIFITEGVDGLQSGFKLIDFEAGKFEDPNFSDNTVSTSNVGKQDYMAPELFGLGHRPDIQSDIYSFALTVHEALLGKLPFKRGDMVSRMKDPVAPHAGANLLAPGLGEVLAGCFEAEPARRPQSFRELLRRFDGLAPRVLFGTSPRRYELLNFIGEGGFGQVFKAALSFGSGGRVSFVAIKNLTKPEQSERFKREARTLDNFKDPRIVRFLDYFEVGGSDNLDISHFLVMDYLDGMPGASLRDRLKTARAQTPGEARSGLPADEVSQAFEKYCGGLSLLHKSKVYHRDIKPDNLYLPFGAPEKACLMDLGIVRDENATRTNRGYVPGTLDYMAPETTLADGLRGSVAADIYALGLCLSEALTGYRVFPKIKDWGALAVRAANPITPNFSHLEKAAPQFVGLLSRMIAWDPADRPASADAVLAELVRIASGEDSGPITVATSGTSASPTLSAAAPTRSTIAATGSEARPPTVKDSASTRRRTSKLSEPKASGRKNQPARKGAPSTVLNAIFCLLVIAAAFGVIGFMLKKRWAQSILPDDDISAGYIAFNPQPLIEDAPLDEPVVAIAPEPPPTPAPLPAAPEAKPESPPAPAPVEKPPAPTPAPAPVAVMAEVNAQISEGIVLESSLVGRGAWTRHGKTPFDLAPGDYDFRWSRNDFTPVIERNRKVSANQTMSLLAPESWKPAEALSRFQEFTNALANARVKDNESSWKTVAELLLQPDLDLTDSVNKAVWGAQKEQGEYLSKAFFAKVEKERAEAEKRLADERKLAQQETDEADGFAAALKAIAANPASLDTTLRIPAQAVIDRRPAEIKAAADSAVAALARRVAEISSGVYGETAAAAVERLNAGSRFVANAEAARIKDCAGAEARRSLDAAVKRFSNARVEAAANVDKETAAAVAAANAAKEAAEKAIRLEKEREAELERLAAGQTSEIKLAQARFLQNDKQSATGLLNHDLVSGSSSFPALCEYYRYIVDADHLTPIYLSAGREILSALEAAEREINNLPTDGGAKARAIKRGAGNGIPAFVYARKGISESSPNYDERVGERIANIGSDAAKMRATFKKIEETNK